MKLLFLLSFCCLFLIGLSQISEDFIIKNQLKSTKEIQKILTNENLHLNRLSTKVSSPLYLVNPEPGIHTLPLDGMPCIVPDTKDIAAIPNAMSNSLIPFKNTMPNAVPQDIAIPVMIEKIKSK